MPVFPLPFVPSVSYKTGGHRFGATGGDRGTRRHAGCDLIAPDGTEVRAVTSGTVIGGPYPFYHGAWAIEVRHPTFVARYCEIRWAPGLGGTVTDGQVIGYVQRMQRDSMLHFEMYSGASTGQLTVRTNPPYERRSDLIDPTNYLDQWASTVSGQP